MVQCIIVADDLTGGNATAVLLKKHNLRTASLLSLEGMDSQNLTQYDVVVYPTESRSIPPEQAYERVRKATETLKSTDVKLYGKRIDSTLRGNMGSEIDAMLDALGGNYIAIVAPCFPQAGRIAVGGYLLVNGLMLQKSDAARDPKNPIHTSLIEKILKEQTKNRVKSIFLDAVYSGVENLQNEIKESVNQGYRIIIVDALNEEDLDNIAEAAIGSGFPFITVDPGTFTAAAAGKLISARKQSKGHKLLMSIGSVSNLTKIQVEEVCRVYPVHRVEMQADRLVYDEDGRKAEIQRVADEVLKHEAQGQLFCVTLSSLDPDRRVDLKRISVEQGTTEEQLSLSINNSVANVAEKVFQTSNDFKGIFSSGGDITVAICKRFGSSGIELIQEVIPLAAFGTLMGGDFPDTKIVTKGGMVGDKDGMVHCVKFLLGQLKS